jgi:hypothetical protein
MSVIRILLEHPDFCRQLYHQLENMVTVTRNALIIHENAAAIARNALLINENDLVCQKYCMSVPQKLPSFSIILLVVKNMPLCAHTKSPLLLVKTMLMSVITPFLSNRKSTAPIMVVIITVLWW